MSPNEVWVAIVFGYIGYLIVSVLISPKIKNNGAKSNPQAATPSSNQPQNENAQDFTESFFAQDGEATNASWFDILDVPKTASLEIITLAYKRKISQYHPDKVAGLGSELKELAELKSKQINAAYDDAKKQVGA